MDQTAANGAAITHLDIADGSSRLWQQRTFCSQQLRAFDLIVCGQRTDDDLVVSLGNTSKAGNFTEIDQQLGAGEPELQQRPRR